MGPTLLNTAVPRQEPLSLSLSTKSKKTQWISLHQTLKAKKGKKKSVTQFK